MNRAAYDKIIAEIEKHMEGDGYLLNIWLVGGATFFTYAVTPAVDDVVMLSRGDHPPVWVAIPAIAAIELCS